MQRWKYIIFAVVFGLFYGIIYTGTVNEMLLSDIVLKLSFSEFALCGGNASYIGKIMLCFFPSVIFQMISGIELYKHFCTGSVYYFSRCINRKKWYLKEIINLYLDSAVYFIFLSLSFITVMEFSADIHHNFREAIWLYLYYIVIFSLWNYFFSLLLNLTALYFRSNGGFAISLGIQMFFISCYVFFQEKLIFIYEGNTDSVRLMKLIPFSHLILFWHSSNNKKIDNLINIYGIDFNLNSSVILLIIADVIISFAGMIIIEKTDFILTNKETGG